MKNSRELLMGIMAGAAAGVIIGMLIAPEKGEDLRKTIRDTAGDWAKKLRDIVEEGKEQTRALAEQVQRDTGGSSIGAEPSRKTP